MGMSTGGGGGGNPLDGEPGVQTVLSEINVTPFVDVMLVLLVIFMVTAPLMTQGVEVNLPRVSAQNLAQLDEEPVIVTVTADNVCHVLDVEIPCLDLRDKLPSIYENRSDQSLFIRGDVDTTYGALMEVLAAGRAAGIISVGLITEAPTSVEEEEGG